MKRLWLLLIGYGLSMDVKQLPIAAGSGPDLMLWLPPRSCP
jgi:hypothetical protein